jgi:uncharacterized Zn-binding protein involved in type VI secretion
MRKVIRLGDSTSHGGKVVSCKAQHLRVKGRPVACIGDPCSCPIPGHNGCKIVQGAKRHTVSGRQIAFEGDMTSCGAKLISSCGEFSSS